MSEPLLVLDATYLCHRAYHAMDGLAHGGVGTGAIFGVLKDIISFQEYFKSSRVVFAFDVPGGGHRHSILPTYKSSRVARHAEESDEDREARADFTEQVRKLRTHYLPIAGFKNVFYAKGFEADDIIASVCAGMAPHDEAIIIGTDKDLYQCLRGNVWMWNPQTKAAYTAESFVDEWGIAPKRWASVKAFAGCSTDDVPGVRGAGEMTVAKYLRGELPTHHKIYQMLAAGKAIHDRNLAVVKLPYPGTPTYSIQTDEVTEESWMAAAQELGMKSIAAVLPRGAAHKPKGRDPCNRKGFFDGKGE